MDAATFFFWNLNAVWCCVISFFVAVIFWSIPLYFFIRWRREVCERDEWMDRGFMNGFDIGIDNERSYLLFTLLLIKSFIL